MKTSLTHKLNTLVERHEELALLLGSADIISNQQQFKAFSKEYAQLQEIVDCFRAYQESLHAITQAQALLHDEDQDMRNLAAQELAEHQQQVSDLNQHLQVLLLPNDPHDASDIYLEIRAGTGGDEAAIFAGDLFRMYSRYAEHERWQLEILSSNAGEHGGYKEIIAKISGERVFSRLKFESGAHRVQRIPETESQGRIHTSACTVAILPEVQAIDAIEISPNELKVDTFRASGAGGQHVNKTDSAIRITHLPTGTVVECQDERSQHKNRARAMSLLSSKLLDEQQRQQQLSQAQKRRSLVGSGDRSERIRTYNYPQNRLTDHRINLTLYKLGMILEGELEQVINPLVHEYQAEQLAQMATDDE